MQTKPHRLTSAGQHGKSGSEHARHQKIPNNQSLPIIWGGARVAEKQSSALDPRLVAQPASSSMTPQVGKCMCIKVCSLFLPSLTWQALRLNQTVIIY